MSHGPTHLHMLDATPHTRASWPRRHRYAVLFIFLLFSIVAYPYAEGSTFGYYAFRTIGSAVILLTVYVVTLRRRVLVLVLCLAIPALLQRTMIAPTDSGNAAFTSRVLSLIFDLLVVVLLFRSVYADNRPTSETIFGALSIYLLLGFSFASIYGLIVSIQPNAFYLEPLVNAHRAPDRFDFIYYSFGTLTELGSPGITAISREVRSVSLLEAVLGIFYLAVLISRIMSTYRAAAFGVGEALATADTHASKLPPRHD